MSKSVFDKTNGNKEKHPFSTLEIGESFPIPEGISTQTMRCNSYQRGISLGRKFKVSHVTRTVERIS